MNAEFNWWLLIVGLVIGAAVVYLVLADSSRRDADVTAEERPVEATWIAATLRAEGLSAEPRTIERALELHSVYLTAPPPDNIEDEDPEQRKRVEVGAADERAAEQPSGVEVDTLRAAEPHRSARRDAPDVERD